MKSLRTTDILKISFAAAIVFSAIVLIAMYVNLRRAEEVSLSERNSLSTLLHLEDFKIRLTSLDTLHRKFMMNDDTASFMAFRQEMSSVRLETARLMGDRRDSGDTLTQATITAGDDLINHLNRTAEEKFNRGADTPMLYSRADTRARFTAFRAQTEKLREYKRSYFEEASKENVNYAERLIMLFFVLAGLFSLSIIGAYIFIMQDFNDRAKLQQNLQQLTERLRGEVTLSDEALRFSNERYELVAKATNDALWDWDIARDELRGNDIFSFIFEIQPGESINYKKFTERVHPEDRERIRLKFLDALRAKDSLLTDDFRFRAGKGEYTSVYDRAYILYDENGRATRMLGAMQDVTDRKQAEDALRELASHLEEAREAERTHMAREIHDELGQQLTGLKMDIAWLATKLAGYDESISNKIKETIALVDGTVITVRRLATQLRPGILDDLGLIAALEWQSEDFQKRSGIRSTFHSNVATIDLPDDKATAIFRVFQESLTNVARHSKGTEVNSSFFQNHENVVLTITDNGVGFNEEEIGYKKTLGLLGMKERVMLINGIARVNSAPGKGTSVVITVPLSNGKLLHHDQDRNRG